MLRWEGPSARVWGVNECVGKHFFLEAITEVGKQSKGRGVLQKFIDVDVVGRGKKASTIGEMEPIGSLTGPGISLSKVLA